MLAVEYQGGAHYQGTAAIRDAVKKEALNKAGIGYAEVYASDNAEEIRLLIGTRVGWIPDPASARVASQAWVEAPVVRMFDAPSKSTAPCAVRDCNDAVIRQCLPRR